MSSGHVDRTIDDVGHAGRRRRGANQFRGHLVLVLMQATTELPVEPVERFVASLAAGERQRDQ